MTCRQIWNRLPGYLDGGIRAGDRARVRTHLESCEACRAELERYHKLSVLLGRTLPAAAPPELATQIRIRVSQARTAESRAHRFWVRTRIVFKDILEPLAVPATGGVITAVLVFIFVVQGLLVGMPVGAVPNDLPTNLMQPARLESLAPFPAPGIMVTNDRGDAGVLLVEATLDARGGVVNYNILAGPDTSAVRRQLDQVLLFSRFRPQMSFGRPTSGGRVMLSFSEVRVKG
jgi:hypothetical protein